MQESKLQVGDTVLVRKVGLKGKQKLVDKWEQEPYLVKQIPNSDILVYRVQREVGKGPFCTLHCNMLLPFTVIPSEEIIGGISHKIKPKEPTRLRR